MKKIFTLFAIITALALSSCSSSAKKSSPLDGEWTSKGKSITGKVFKAPMKWAPGQYVVIGTINDGEKESITRSLVVKKEAGGWVFETTTTNKKKKVTGMQMLIKGYEQAIAKKDASLIKVVWMKMLQENGTVQTIEGDNLLIYNVIMKSAWDNIIISGTTSAEGGAVVVPAGSFAGTTKMSTSVKILFATIKGTSWLHPDVPVNGVVKSSSGDSKTELLDFGFNGKPVIQ